MRESKSGLWGGRSVWGWALAGLLGTATAAVAGHPVYGVDPEMTSPDYDAADFSNAGMVYATQADGRIDTLPQVIDYWVIYWNKALFDAKGVAYPDTLDGLLEAAKALNDDR